MPYKRTYVTTKMSADIPDFDVWLENLDLTTLEDFSNVNAESTEIIHEDSQKYASQTGLISTNSYSTNDGLSWHWEEVWESQDAWLASLPVLVKEDPLQPVAPLSTAEKLKNLYNQTFNFTEEMFEANI